MAPPNFLFPLFVSGQLASVLLGRAIDGTGLTPNEFAVLSMVAVYEPVPPSELAQRAGMPATTMSDYVARLHGRKLVKRSPHPEDGRSYRVELTAEGRRRNSRAVDGLMASNEAIAGQLGVQPDRVREALLELEQALRLAVSTES